MDCQIIRVKDYKCPKCKIYPNVDDQYTVNGVVYPIITNEHSGSTLDGSYWDWDETHCCIECNTIYSYSNGAY